MERLHEERDSEPRRDVDVPAVVTPWHEFEAGSTSAPGRTPRDCGEDEHRREHYPQENESRLQHCCNCYGSGAGRETKHPKGQGSPGCASVDVTKPREHPAPDHGHPGPPG